MNKDNKHNDIDDNKNNKHHNIDDNKHNNQTTAQQRQEERQ